MAEKSTSPSRGWLVGIGVAVAALILAFVARSHFRDKVEVRTAKVSHADVMSVVSTNGKIEPVRDFQAHAPSAGVVKQIFVQVGSHVTAGQPLLKMDDSDARSHLATAQAQLESANASLKNMQSGGNQEERNSLSADLANAQSQQKQALATLTATQALQAKGSASASEVAAAQQRLSDAQARLSQLKTRATTRYSGIDVNAQQAQVSQARAALFAAQSGYSGVDIRAPFAGTVYSVPVNQYDFVQFGEALLNMADLNRIQVRAYFDEPEIGKLAAGQPVKIVWDAKPFASWQGHIERAPSTIITYGTRNVGECMIAVDDAKGALLPNTNVTVTVTVSQLKNILSLPREALRTEGVRNFVYRIVDGRLKRTEVQVGALNLTRVQILGGINDGDSVVLSSPSNAELQDNLEVKALP